MSGTTKVAEVPAAKASTPLPDEIRASMTAAESTATAKHSQARKAAAPMVQPNATTAEATPDVQAAITLLESNGYRVTGRKSSGPRATMPKADPNEVAAYFRASGLSRKELAAVVGVSTSVIGTVAKMSGDRWSQVRFDAAKVLIDAEAARRAKAAAKSEPKKAPR
jgi:hypothetical protein